MAGYSLDFWKTLLPHLELWRGLSLTQRRAATRLAPTYQDPIPELAALPPAVAGQLFETDAKGRQRAGPGLRRLLAFLQRLADWTLDDSVDVALHVQQLTTYDQRLALTGLRSGTSTEVITAALVRRILEGGFAKTLLASDSPGYYLASISGWLPEGQEFREAHLAALRTWVGKILEEDPDSLPLTADTFRVEGSRVPPEEMVHLLLNHGLLLLSLEPDSLEPMIHVPVPFQAVRQGPENLVLRKFTGRENFVRPFLIDDMDVYLRALKADPAPLLSDGVNVSVAYHRKVARNLLPMPFAATMPGWEDESRAAAAWWMSERLGLVSVSGRGRKTMKASLGPKGEAWLKLTRDERLERILQQLPCGRRKAHPVSTRFSWLGDFAVHAFPYAALSAEIFEGMDAAIARLETPVAFSGWAESAAKGFNPLVAAAERDLDLGARWMRWDEPPQSVYARLLQHQAARLASVGAIVFSVDEDVRIGLSLTGVGRWLYGLAESWSLPAEGRPIAVVGGDFTVTMLEASPILESDLIAFAEPAGESGMAGTAFKITRQSVQKAVHGGQTAGEMLSTLRRWSKNAVPANVAHEIAAWAGSRRTFTLRESILIECEDPVVAAELHSQFSKDFEKISPTVLEYVGAGARQALVKRLAKKGFFTD